MYPSFWRWRLPWINKTIREGVAWYLEPTLSYCYGNTRYCGYWIWLKTFNTPTYPQNLLGWKAWDIDNIWWSLWVIIFVTAPTFELFYKVYTVYTFPYKTQDNWWILNSVCNCISTALLLIRLIWWYCTIFALFKLPTRDCSKL